MEVVEAWLAEVEADRDEEAEPLPTRIDKETLGRLEISTCGPTPAASTCSPTCRGGTGAACATTRWVRAEAGNAVTESEAELLTFIGCPRKETP